MISGRGTTATPLLAEKEQLIYKIGAWLVGKARNSSVAIIFFVTVEASRNISCRISVAGSAHLQRLWNSRGVSLSLFKIRTGCTTDKAMAPRRHKSTSYLSE